MNSLETNYREFGSWLSQINHVEKSYKHQFSVCIVIISSTIITDKNNNNNNNMNNINSSSSNITISY